MKCKLFFSLLFISISISAQNNIEINLSKKQLREIKKIEKFKLMGLNNYGIDVNAMAKSPVPVATSSTTSVLVAFVFFTSLDRQ